MCGSDLHNYRAPAHAPGTVTGGVKREASITLRGALIDRYSVSHST